MSKKSKIYRYKTLRTLVIRLRDDLNNKNFVLLFAYNSTGKTRLSMAFKEWGKKQKGKKKNDIKRDTLYFNAFTEDLFVWHNDFENDNERYLEINQNSRFFIGVKELALEEKIFAYLGRYVDFDFKIDYEQWTVTFSHGDTNHIKISRGEENIFIWCFFLAIAELAIDDSESYNWVKHLYIDDPISSLDDNNVIAVASDLAQLLKKGKGRVKTVISSHHALFFNVMCNELKTLSHKKYFLHRENKSNNYTLQVTDETPFFQHVAMLSELQQAVESEKLYTHHFNMLRSILEKTASFFGFDDFSACLHGVDDKVLYARALNLLSHGKYSIYEQREMTEDTRELFKNILKNFLARYQFDLPELRIKETTQESQT